MKKNYILMFSIILSFVLTNNLKAQISTYYSFSEVTSTYTPITTGDTILKGLNSDDGEQSAVPIGFTFSYETNTYTTLTIGANGGISFTNTNVDYTNNLDGTDADQINIIAPLWDDLYQRTADGGTISYLTSGTAPNRVFTVQWKNLSWRNAGNTVNFQLQLFETSNNIRFNYGASTSTQTSRSASIGFNNGSSGSDFISVTPGTPATVSNTSANDAILSTEYPGANKSYLFTYTPPSCPVPLGFSFSNTSSDSTDISWTYGSTPIAFGYEYGLTGYPVGSGTPGSTTTTSATIAGLTANTTYDVYMRVLCAVGDTSLLAGPFTFTTECLTFTSFPYKETFNDTSSTESCWTVLNNNADADAWNTDQTGYAFGGSNQSAAIYTDFNGGSNDDYLISPKFTLTGNQRVKFQVRSRSTGEPNDYHVVLSSTGKAATDFSTTVLIDTVASTTYSERVLDLSSYTGDYYIAFKIPPGGLDGYWLYIDEFLIEDIPNCPEPAVASLNAHAITATSANVNWTEAGTATSWRVEYGLPGFTLGTGVSSVESNDTVSLSGLTPFTTYEFYVTALCTASDSSPWVGPYSFTTLCQDTNLGPWSDDVEGHPSTSVITGISNCWSGTKSGSSFEWEITSSGTTGSSNTGALSAHSGTNYFYTEASGAGSSDTTTLISPSIDVSSLTSPFLEFYYHMFGNQMGSLNVQVYNGTTWTSELMISGAQQATQASPWNQQYVDLSSYSGIIKLRFVAVSNGSYEGDICIDDIAVIEEPACFAPSMVTTAGTINDSTTVSWTQQFGSPSKWLVEYGATGFTLGTGTLDSTTTTSIGIGGLTGSTTYDVYVRSYCGGTDSSAWIGPITFTTQCDPYSPTYSEDFATYTPTCWEEAKGRLTASTNLVYGTSFWGSGGYRNVGSSGAAKMNIYTTNRNEWLISAPIDLGDGSIPYQVEFDAALTNYNNSGTDMMGPDDTLAFVISTDYGQTWTTANILRNYVSGDEPTNAGSREFIDLSSYSGVVKFGFYAASTVSNTDYDVHIDNFLVTNLCVPTAVTINDTACGTYTSPSGKNYTSTGTYMDTIPMVRGCDSVITINLLVKNTTASVVTTVCDSYTTASGKVITTTGMYMDTVTNSLGCDSIISINLTVNYNKTKTDVVTVCDSYTRPGGIPVNYSGTFIDTIPTVLGCDSVVTTVLTVNYTTSSTITATVCGSYTSPSGKVWLTSGSRFDTIPNASGCDSLMTIIITVKANTSETRTVSACFSYTVPETGNVYTTSGTYTDVTTNAFGCPHTITTNLTINTANAGTITLSGTTFTASATGVSYRWADCDNNYSHMLHDTNQTFTPVRNGNFACIITTADGCSDTTNCLSVNTVSLEEFVVTENDISIYPNPASYIVNIDILRQNANEDVTIRLFDAIGKLVYTKTVSSTNNKVSFDVSTLEGGVYTVSVSNEFFTTTKKLTVVN